MWSSNAARRALSGLALAATILLAGCTLAPVHSERTGGSVLPLALNYAEPQNRLEQIVYQTLGARFHSGEPNSPLLSAKVSARASRIGLSKVASPVIDRQVEVTIAYEISTNGEVVANGTRSATALYQTTDQLVADDAALAKAEDQATRAAAETVRLAILSTLQAQ